MEIELKLAIEKAYIYWSTKDQINMNTLHEKELFEDQLIKCVACGSKEINYNHERCGRDVELKNIMFSLWKCRTCKAVFINPRPKRKMLEKIYKKSGHSLQKPITLEEVLFNERECPNSTVDANRIISVAKEYLNFNKKLKVLDVGSGYGFITNTAINNGFDVTAINPSVWENNVFEQINLFRPIQKFFEDTVFTEKYNLVVMSHILEHVDDPLRFLNKVKSLLTENGIIAFAVPNLNSIWVKIGMDGGVYWIPEHLSCFTKISIEHLLDRSGFKVIKLMGISRVPFFVLSNKLKLKGKGRKICNAFVKISQWFPLKICNFIGMSGVLNVWAKIK